jgi:hypothetical protein
LTISAPAPGAVDQFDELALVVALMVLELETTPVGFRRRRLHMVDERGRAVDVGLPLAQQVEVGP